jgi:hypothetical protein
LKRRWPRARSLPPSNPEFIRRRGDGGFAKGNFKALFESIELKQMQRGALTRQSAKWNFLITTETSPCHFACFAYCPHHAAAPRSKRSL